LHLHRLSPDVLFGGRGALPVSATRRGCDFRHARVVYLVADFGPNPGDVPSQASGRKCSALAESPGPGPEGVRPRVRGVSVGIQAVTDKLRGHPIHFWFVVNFQSWLDPFIIITALPAALAGIIVFLFLTHTALSVPALMGAIMCMGVATANSILVVAFATERLAAHGDPLQAAIEAGFTRFRPVLMTALAMIIGMIPMALGLGDGGEENAPLGRAVVGGLLCATVATLVFVPTVFGLLHGMRS